MSNIKKANKDNALALSDEDMHAICDILQYFTPHKFEGYKSSTLKRRILRRMKISDCKDITKYKALLKSSKEEQQRLLQDFLINVTDFFRDKEAFKYLSDYIIPEIFKSSDPSEGIKVWVCGCSTGEEAYSIAICIQTYLEDNDLDVPYRIFATDVSEQNIINARANKFKINQMSGVPKSVLDRFFQKKGEYYGVDNLIKTKISFSVHNILSNPTVIKTDFISCRNLLIYLKLKQQYNILQKILISLKDKGILWLGANESSKFLNTSFETINEKWKFYKKKSTNTTIQFENIYNFDGSFTIPRDIYMEQKTNNIRINFQSELISKFGFCAFYINQNYDIINTIGNYKQFLQLPEDQLKLNLIAMLPKPANYEVRSAIIEARQMKKEQYFRDVHLNQQQVFDVCVIENIEDKQDLILVIFGKLRTLEKVPETADKNCPSNGKQNYINSLESELEILKSKLSTINLNYDNTFQDLQQANEELLSNNEEMQSSNEELKALNEELNNLNVEHQHKINELKEINDDLDNYFKNTLSGQLIIDNDYIIKRFNPRSQMYFNILPQDIGRPIFHISNQFVDLDVIDILKDLDEDEEFIIKEVRLKNKHTSMMRLARYLKKNGEKAGFVLSFYDITELKRSNSIISAVYNSNINAYISIFPYYDPKSNNIVDFHINSVNNKAELILGLKERDIVNCSIFDVSKGKVDKNRIETLIKSYNEKQTLQEEMEFEVNGQKRYYQLNVIPIDSGLLLIFSNHSKLMNSYLKEKASRQELTHLTRALDKTKEELEKEVEKKGTALSEVNEKLRMLTWATNDIILDYNLINGKMWVSDNFYNIFNYKNDVEIKSHIQWKNLIFSKDRTRIQNLQNKLIKEKDVYWEAEYRIKNGKGEYISVKEKGYIIYDKKYHPSRIISSVMDITTINEAKKIIAKELEEKENFISLASHELKTPITTIKGMLQLLRRYIDNENVKEITRDLIHKVNTQSENLERFVNELLDETRIRDGKFQMYKKEIHLMTVMQNFENYKTAYPDFAFQIFIDDDIKDLILGDEIRIEQIFNNLISNAVKFSKDKKVIKIVAKNVNTNIQISITDYGIGIKENLNHKVFDKFYKQYHGQGNNKGLGLGLYITNEIVKGHNGKLTYDSKLGHGTTFLATFPLIDHHI